MFQAAVDLVRLLLFIRKLKSEKYLILTLRNCEYEIHSDQQCGCITLENKSFLRLDFKSY